MSYRILTLNNISITGLERFPRDRYEVASEIGHPDAVLLRSMDMHDMDLPESVKAVARAGAGTNNIPVDRMTALGVPVFNAPGANANAVKELVVTGMFLAARNVCQAWAYTRDLEETGEALEKAVEAGKKRFVGSELPGRTLGVIGLGAIGVQVANAAHALGMKVLGFDPKITVERAWQLSADVEQAATLDELFSRADYISPHVPLVDGTRGLIDAHRIGLMKAGSVLLNFARGPIVDEAAVIAALESGSLSAYVCDFPSEALLAQERCIALPHLGASTREAEENCAMMAVDRLREYLEDGNIRHSVNFPDVYLPRTAGAWRLGVANANVPNMVGQISTALAEAQLNIIDMLNKSRGDVAYTLVDVEAEIPTDTLERIASIEGVLAVRAL